MVIRVLWCISFCRKDSLLFCDEYKKVKGVASVLVVLGSGGHTSEMMALLGHLDPSKLSFSYVLADTDTSSLYKANTFQSALGKPLRYWRIPRSREVGQSYFTSVFTTFIAIVKAFGIIWASNADMLLCNGPGTCVPLCLVAFLLRVFYIRRMHVVFVESFCRVKTMSLTGKILYYTVSRFIVQWPQLKEQYPKTNYFGVLC